MKKKKKKKNAHVLHRLLSSLALLGKQTASRLKVGQTFFPFTD